MLVSESECSYTGQWILSKDKITAHTVSYTEIELASGDSMSCEFPIPAGAGTEGVLIAECLALRSNRCRRGPDAGHATGTYL